MKQQLFKTSADTARINEFGVQAADVIDGLAQENDQLWDNLVKVSEDKHAAQQRAGMLELGLQAAKAGRLQYGQVERWATQKISEGKTVEQMTRVMGLMDDYGPGELTLNGETVQANKTSSARQNTGRSSRGRIKVKPHPVSNGGVSSSFSRSVQRMNREMSQL